MLGFSFETVEIIVIRQSEMRWFIDVRRSFSSWLWLALVTTADAVAGAKPTQK